MLENTISVVVKDKEIDFEYLEYLHHFLARKNYDGTYTIIDFFGRAADLQVSNEQFESMLQVISEQEFSDYADAIQSGESELYDRYLKVLNANYNLTM